MPSSHPDPAARQRLGRVPLPVWLTNARGRVTWLNVPAAALLGDRRGDHFTRFLAPDDVAAARERFALRMLGRPGPCVQALTLRTPAGDAPVEVAVVPVLEGARTVAAVWLVRAAEAAAEPAGPWAQAPDLPVEGCTWDDLRAGDRLDALVAAFRAHVL